MKSAHSDERNLAHCAATAMSSPKQVSNHELTKLKEDYERQIQTLKLEHKIQLLEMDNKISKQILELQKENQSLKHENEMMKLKSAHDLQSNKMVVDANLEKQMVAKAGSKPWNMILQTFELLCLMVCADTSNIVNSNVTSSFVTSVLVWDRKRQ